MSARTVTVYTVTWCPHCVRLLQFLDAEGIRYVNHDVDEDDPRWREMLGLTGGQDIVPVATCDGQVVFGAFNAEFQRRLKVWLGLAER